MIPLRHKEINMELVQLDGFCLYRNSSMVSFAGRRNTSIGPKINRETLFSLMGGAYARKAVTAVKECT